MYVMAALFVPGVFLDLYLSNDLFGLTDADRSDHVIQTFLKMLIVVPIIFEMGSLYICVNALSYFSMTRESLVSFYTSSDYSIISKLLLSVNLATVISTLLTPIIYIVNVYMYQLLPASLLATI